jgi:phosphate-selective porin OprO/OprP
VAAPRESIQLRDRPELRIDQNRLIDTGLIPVKNADEYGIELAASWRNFLLQGEYIRIDVDQSALGRVNAPTLGFEGGYIEGSWVITGEPRRYVPTSAAFARPKPADPFTLGGGGWGAWELVARYSITDLNSHVSRDVPASVTGGVFGGRQEVYSAGLSWYPNDAIRFILQYQYVDVSRFDSTGSLSVGQNFHTLAGRAQVAF